MRSFKYLLVLIMLTTACDKVSNSYDQDLWDCQIDMVPEIRIFALNNFEKAPTELGSITALYLNGEGQLVSTKPNEKGCFAVNRPHSDIVIRSSESSGLYKLIPNQSFEGKIQVIGLDSIDQFSATTLQCPAKGIVAADQLKLNQVIATDSRSEVLEQTRVVLSDDLGQSNMDFPLTQFGINSPASPTMDVSHLAEGRYRLELLTSSVFDENPFSKKSNVQSCPLTIIRSCTDSSEFFDYETLSCQPKLCDGQFVVNQLWNTAVDEGRGTRRFQCQLIQDEPQAIELSFTCQPGYFKSENSCQKAIQMKMFTDKTSCALLENGKVQCWGNNPDYEVERTGEAFLKDLDYPRELSPFPGKVTRLTPEGTFCAELDQGGLDCRRIDERLPLQGSTELKIRYPVEGTDITTFDQVNDVWSDCIQLRDSQAWHCARSDSGAYPQQASEYRLMSWDLTEMTKDAAAVLVEGNTACSILDNSNHWDSGFVFYAHKVTCWKLDQSIGLELEGLRIIETRGQSNRCALSKSGDIFCWGRILRDEDGKAIGQVLVPEKLPLSQKLSHNFISDCALTAENDVYCWNATYSEEEKRYEVDGRFIEFEDGARFKAKQFDSASRSYCAISLDDRVLCWGDNSHGQLGNDFRRMNRRFRGVIFEHPVPVISR